MRDRTARALTRFVTACAFSALVVTPAASRGQSQSMHTTGPSALAQRVRAVERDRLVPATITPAHELQRAMADAKKALAALSSPPAGSNGDDESSLVASSTGRLRDLEPDTDLVRKSSAHSALLRARLARLIRELEEVARTEDRMLRQTRASALLMRLTTRDGTRPPSPPPPSAGTQPANRSPLRRPVGGGTEANQP